MPDGDIVHKGLAPRYQAPYKQMCEGQLSDEAVARNVARAVLKDIQHYGNEPLKLLEQTAGTLQGVQDKPLFIETEDWGELSQAIHKVAQDMRAYKTAINLATRACEEQKTEIRNHHFARDLDLDIAGKYIHGVYTARFEEQVPLTDQHYGGADKPTLDRRLDRLRPLVMQELDALATQIV